MMAVLKEVRGNLHDAVASIKFSAHFQHTNNLEQKGASENGLKAVENGGRGWD